MNWMQELRFRLSAVEFARQRLGFEPDTVQAQVLDPTIHRGMLNCSRQWGKSTVTAIKALHHALYERGSLVIVMSPSERQSGMLVRKARGFAAELGMTVRGDGSTRASLVLPNGSRIVGLPGTDRTTRGYSGVSLMLVDEAAQVKDHVYQYSRAFLASVKGKDSGALWLMSTPFGRRGFFYETWAHGGAAWKRFQVPGAECPRIRASFLEEERQALGETLFRHYSESVVIPSQCLSLS